MVTKRGLRLSQNNALKAVLNTPLLNLTEMLHKDLEWLDVEHTCVEVNKCTNDLQPEVVVGNAIEPYTSECETRMSNENGIVKAITRTVLDARIPLPLSTQ